MLSSIQGNILLKYIVLSTLFILCLEARDNPFVSSDSENRLTYSTNVEKQIEPFTQSSISLPSDARVIKKITIEYESLDASTNQKSVELDNSLDWHKPFYISQNLVQNNFRDAKIESILKNSDENIDASERNVVYEVDLKNVKVPTLEKVEVVKVIEKVITKPVEEFKKVASIKLVSFYVKGKTIKLIVSEKIIRNFLLVNPHRIVLDFKKNTQIRSYIKRLKVPYFSAIRIGNHKGYYRVVIELDGLYKYKTSKLKDGYSITLK